MSLKRMATLTVVLASLTAVPASRADEAPPVTADMTKGAVTFTSGENTLTIGAWIQADWIGDDKERFDGDTTGSGVGREDGFSSQFKIDRLRAYFQGTMWRSWARYRIEIEFSGTTGENDNKIKDGYIEFAKVPLATVRMGQYKVPFSLQELTPDIRQEFVERAITDVKFAPARDLGVMLLGLTGNKALGYAAGVFNGGGEAKSQDDRSMLYAGRIFWDPLGEYKLSEGPVENPESGTILHFGLAARTGEAARGTATTGVVQDPDNETAYNLECAWRWRSLWATAELFVMGDEQKNPVRGPTVRSRGVLAQLGGMIVPKRFELGARYAEIDPDRAASDDNVREVRGLAAWYFKGHNLKIQLDGGEIIYGAGFSADSALAKRGLPALGTRLGSPQAYHDRQYRIQAQLAF